METLLLNAEETAKLLGLGRTKVYEMLAAGELPVIRIGRAVRVPRSRLQAWIDEHTHRSEFDDSMPSLQAVLTNASRRGGSTGWLDRDERS